MTDPTALALLRDAESYLSALHGSVALHDVLAANLGCAGCELRDRITAALPTLAAVQPHADRAALRDRIAHALEREDAINAGYDHGFASSYGADPETDGFVEAVLAVLSEPVSRATEEAHPPRHRWCVEHLDGVAGEWIPGTRFLNRHHAVERYQYATEKAPTWKDGTPVQRRLVRETTSYTVEDPRRPADEAQQDGEGR